MKLLKSINPKKIISFKKPKSSPTITKSEPPSFKSCCSSSSSSSESSTHNKSGPALTRTRSEEICINLKSDRPWIEETFKMMDLDGDGKITRVELHSIFNRVRVNAPSLTEDEVAEMIKDIDIDGDGCISFQELEAVGSVFDPTSANEEDLKGAFDFFDGDHDGKISAEELFQGFMALGDERCTLEDCRRMIEDVDKNKDGFVCFEDFCRMMCSSSTHR
ncbi:probable calcium-binding protein CML36 [Amaranthus tricolor]|uniref:probable calcium-binding protein CML36 n=1 Tax=Amaranthus tricolor TaxID=29722 RepID=UPI002589408E|nr:probable calcium-binding protein CML36 [Amaranthus tricolor]